MASYAPSPSNEGKKKGLTLSFDAPSRSAGGDAREGGRYLVLQHFVRSHVRLSKRSGGDECARCREVNGGIKAWLRSSVAGGKRLILSSTAIMGSV